MRHLFTINTKYLLIGKNEVFFLNLEMYNEQSIY